MRCASVKRDASRGLRDKRMRQTRIPIEYASDDKWNAYRTRVRVWIVARDVLQIVAYLTIIAAIWTTFIVVTMR